MMVKLLLPVLVLLSCLSMSGPANAYPWNSLEGYETSKVMSIWQTS